MKIPKYAYQPVTTVCHPASTLKDVAKWLEIESTLYRKEGNVEGALSLKAAAWRLRNVAAGTSPAEAFEWPKLS
jgi:hypothetical protein